MRWAGHVPAGQVNKTTSLAAVDLLPTVCAAVKVNLLSIHRQDGENMLDTLLGKQQSRAKTIFWNWRGVESQPETWPRWIVRHGDLRMVRDDSNRVELYRSHEDWAETSNVAKDHPDVLVNLTAQLVAWRATLPAMPDPKCLSESRSGK